MNKLSFIFAGVFGMISVFAIATDYSFPQGYNTTPIVKKTKNVRERSVYVRGTRHRGFMHGK